MQQSAQKTCIIPRFRHNPLKNDPVNMLPNVKKCRPSSSSTTTIHTTTGTASTKNSSRQVPTKCITPKFYSRKEMEQRRKFKEKKIKEDRIKTVQINTFRSNQRTKIKQELMKEKQQMILKGESYKADKINEWKKRTSKSPFAVNLVADVKRIKEYQAMRRLSELKKQMEIKKLNELRNSLIMQELQEKKKEALIPTKNIKKNRQDGKLWNEFKNAIQQSGVNPIEGAECS